MIRSTTPPINLGNGTLIKRTNKAEVYRMRDGSVVKHYFSKNAQRRVLQDERSLRYLAEAFGKVRHNGWSYGVVRPLWFDADKALVCMENVSGCPVAELARERLQEAEFHAGVWLALYHDKVLDGNQRGYIYTDFTIHNVLVDFEKKTVVAIDPGTLWQRKGDASEDLVKHLHSVTVGLTARRLTPLNVIGAFLRGYSSTTKRATSPRLYYQGLCRELLRQFVDYATHSPFRCITFPIWIALFSPLYFVVAPLILCTVGQERR